MKRLLIPLAIAKTLYCLFGIISDCDEVFNYWEPLNFLSRHFGKQTWEYSPIYKIRSWSFLLPAYLVSAPFQFLQSLIESVNTQLVSDFQLSLIPAYYQFYMVRLCIGLFSLIGEWKLFQSLYKVDRKVGLWFLLFDIVATGMSHASISLLPSSLVMIFQFYNLHLLLKFFSTQNSFNLYMIVFNQCLASFAGWPFGMALSLPIAVYISCLYRPKKLAMFAFKSILLASAVIIAVAAVDYIFYGSFDIIPLNIVLYNVVNSSQDAGPNIFGTEPISYYVVNLLLNFNFIVVFAYLGLISLPILNMVSEPNVLHSLPNILALLSPMLVWSLVFGSQPHKEERFLYPIYPYILLSASLFVDKFVKLSAIVFSKKGYGNLMKKVLVLSIVVVVSALSLLRTISLCVNYGAATEIYKYLPNTNEPFTVCAGREWYHYPSSYFLPANARFKFVDSGFDGMLPGDFNENTTFKWGLIPNSIAEAPLEKFNSLNRFESDKVVSKDICDYIVDTSETPSIVHDSEWDTVKCLTFIDSASSGLARLVYLPFSKGVFYHDYCLLKRVTS